MHAIIPGMRKSRPQPVEMFDDQRRLVPKLVGTIGTYSPGPASARPNAMFAVVDPDEVPGLRDLLEQQKAGRSFDVVTRCGVGLADDGETASIALIAIAFPEIGLSIELVLDPRQYRDSLLNAIRSGKLMLIDEERSHAHVTLTGAEAATIGLGLVVPLADTKPLMGVLQQQLDFPRKEYQPNALELRDENREDVLEAFISDASVPDQIAIQYRETGTPSIVLCDRRLAKRTKLGDQDQPLQGRWAAMPSTAKSLIRLDVYRTEELFGRWLIFDPDPRIVRAGASGSHHVMLMPEKLSYEQDVAARQWEAGTSVWVEHVDALRAVLRTLP